MQPCQGGPDPAESLNDWRPVILPGRQREAKSGLLLGLCLTSLGLMIIVGALTHSSWLAALACALCFGAAIVNAASHMPCCLRCGRRLTLSLRSSAYLDLIPDPRRCDRCQDPPDAC
jgi:hypothetical protein